MKNKSCPNCGRSLLDNPRECMYCGWGKKEERRKQKENKKVPKDHYRQMAERLAAEINAKEEQSQRKYPQYKSNQVVREQLDKYEGRLTINGAKVDVYEIIAQHGTSNRITIAKIIMQASGCDLELAEIVARNACQKYYTYKKQRAEKAAKAKQYDKMAELLLTNRFNLIKRAQIVSEMWEDKKKRREKVKQRTAAAYTDKNNDIKRTQNAAPSNSSTDYTSIVLDAMSIYGRANKIQMIKYLREKTNMDLRHAKEIVDDVCRELD